MKTKKLTQKLLSAGLSVMMLASPMVPVLKADVFNTAVVASAAAAVKMSACTVTVASKAYYTGKAVTPAVTVKKGKTVLKKGKHYTVKYSANKNCGTATVTVTGIKKSGYTGSKTVKFSIVPATPSLSAKTSTSSAALTWKAVPGASKYIVYSYDAKTKKYKTLATVKATKYTASKLASGTTYNYAVKAVVVQGKKTFNSAVSKVLTVSTLPAKVSGLAASSVTDTTAKLSWKKVNGATGYQVYSYDSKTKKYTLLGKTTALSYNLKNLKGATAYTFVVRAYRTVNKVNYYSSNTTLNVVTAPAKVGGLKASSTDTSVTLTWSKVTGATGYVVYSYNASTKKYTKAATATKTTATISKLSPKTSYSYVVRAYLTSGKTNIYGANSSLITVKTQEASKGAKANLESFQKIINSGTYNINYALDMAEFGGGDDDIPMDKLAMNTYVKNGNVKVDTNVDILIAKVNFTMIYLKDKNIGYMYTEGVPLLMPKSYQEMKGEDAKMDGLLDTAYLKQLFAPEMAKGESIKEGKSGLYATASYKTSTGLNVTYYFLFNNLKKIEVKEPGGDVATIEISKVSGSVSDSVFNLPKNFPDGYEPM